MPFSGYCIFRFELLQVIAFSGWSIFRLKRFQVRALSVSIFSKMGYALVWLLLFLVIQNLAETYCIFGLERFVGFSGSAKKPRVIAFSVMPPSVTPVQQSCVILDYCFTSFVIERNGQK
jgi:hypothetical protein